MPSLENWVGGLKSLLRYVHVGKNVWSCKQICVKQLEKGSDIVHHSKMITCSDFVDVHNLNKQGCRVLHYTINMMRSLYMRNALKG